MEINMKNPFKGLTRFELILWLSSVAAVALSSVLSPTFDLLSLVASLVGVTALIFLAKGYAFGQILVIIFALLYSIVSLEQRYYGEMITYAGMTLPMAVLSLISWLKNPNGDTGEVKVSRLTAKSLTSVLLLTALVTVAFYFILGAIGNASLLVSTVSVTTSFFAAALTFLRSPFYAIGYAANDVVLIILWVIAATADPGAYCVVVCFLAFLVNDLYGFFNWLKMEKRQTDCHILETEKIRK